VPTSAVELVNRLARIFFEGQPAVVVSVELVEILSPGRQILVRLNLPVLVLVVPAEALLLVRLVTRFRRAQGWSPLPPNHEGPLGAVCCKPCPLGPCSARDCQIRKAPVSNRKAAAAPARKRHMGTSIKVEIRR
jgi:hypothetical protein